MAMLEAFVYDPLINWRLLETTAVKPMPASLVEGALIPGAATGVVAEVPAGLQGEDLSMQRPTHHRFNFFITLTASERNSCFVLKNHVCCFSEMSAKLEN
jgi:phosphatidylinositol kinase/protein kinase (PI-3  family)